MLACARDSLRRRITMKIFHESGVCLFRRRIDKRRAKLVNVMRARPLNQLRNRRKNADQARREICIALKERRTEWAERARALLLLLLLSIPRALNNCDGFLRARICAVSTAHFSREKCARRSGSVPLFFLVLFFSRLLRRARFVAACARRHRERSQPAITIRRRF